jgi:phospholipase C
MSPRRWVLPPIVLLAVTGFGQPPQTSSAATHTRSPIRHIVVVYMENHSFNDVLGKLCVIDSRCRGTTTGKLLDGSSIRLAQATDRVPEIGHGTGATLRAINNGAMNGFESVTHCTAADGYPCYRQYDPAQIPNLATLARSFVISDMTFNSSAYSSWVSHIALVSTTKDGFQGNIPKDSQFHERGPGWGCDSFMDANWAPPGGGDYILVPSCIPDQTGFGPYRESPVQWVPTIMDRMDDAGRSWRIDGGEGTIDTSVGTGYAWSTCPAFADCLYTSQVKKFRPASAILRQADIGRLPALALVTPTYKTSQHNNTSMLMGDNWIGSVVGAIMSGPQWSSTAILITYDDCGCFYDPVPPPNNFGIRSPMVIVSPYAKAGFTDSTVASTNSILAFIEHTFSLPPLAAADRDAYDYSNAFDFTQPPPATPTMTHTSIPRTERRWLARHPGREGVT